MGNNRTCNGNKPELCTNSVTCRLFYVICNIIALRILIKQLTSVDFVQEPRNGFALDLSEASVVFGLRETTIIGYRPTPYSTTTLSFLCTYEQVSVKRCSLCEMRLYCSTYL